MTDLFIVNLQCDAEKSLAHPEFQSQHTVSGEKWVPVRPAVTPLMPAFEGKHYY